MKALNLSQWAWIAGLIEGEGCFSLTDTNPSPVFTITMSDEDVIAKLAELLGVKYKVKSPRNERCQTMYHITVRKQSFNEWLISGIYRWMGKRRQAKLQDCIAYYQTKGSQELNHLLLGTNTDPMSAI